MIIQQQPPLHLTYCMNIHPGEHWDDQLQAIKTHVLAIRDELRVDGRFGLGLRISKEAAEELIEGDRLEELRCYLNEQQLYVFTINAFPYGAFHGTRVKEQVYAPDWQTEEREIYTCQLADILAALLPEGIDGSLSTVPGSFKPWIETDEQVAVMADRIISTAIHLEQIHKDTGKIIHLGLEPEPCCFLETTDEFIDFFNQHIITSSRLPEAVIRRHIGICFDCCHIAIQFEDLVESLNKLIQENILISKIHISAALRVRQPIDLSRVAPFDESVYFHQVKGKLSDGAIQSWTDLGEALDQLARMQEARIHFHVPLFWNGDDQLGTTKDQLTPAFFALLKTGITTHLEIETYTFDVLPPALQCDRVEESIVREYRAFLGETQMNIKHP